MNIKPPDVPFDVAEDHARTLGSIEAFARMMREGDRKTGNLLRQLQRLTMIERVMRSLVGDGEAPRALINEANDLSLFPHYRVFRERWPRTQQGTIADADYPHPINEVRLIVQDLAVVWNGEEFEGDGSCTLSKYLRKVDQKANPWVMSTGTPIIATGDMCWPKRAWIFHASRDPWGIVGEFAATGRTFIPPVQNFSLALLPGDYIVGELYVEIC